MTDSVLINIGLFALCAVVVQAIALYATVHLFVTGRGPLQRTQPQPDARITHGVGSELRLKREPAETIPSYIKTDRRGAVQE